MRKINPLGLTSILASACALSALAATGACGSSDSDSKFTSGGGADGSTANGGDGSALGDDDSSTHLNTGDGSAGVTVQKLIFSPASASVTVDGTANKSVAFTLTAQYADGTTSAVTPESIEFDRPDLGTLQNGDPVTATAPSPLGLFGGTGTLHAIYQGLEATATLTVQASVTEYGSGLSATSPGVAALSGSGADGGGTNGGNNLPTDPAANIGTLLYPYDATIFPLGITSPPIMWNAPNANDVYRLHFQEKNFVYDDYVTLAALPGQMRVAQDTWDKLTSSNDAKNGADPIAFTLSRYDAGSKLAYKSTSASWSIAPESLAGAIYYWTTTGNGSLLRIPPGAGATPTAVTSPQTVTNTSNGAQCMGCHAVSADGSTLVAALEGAVGSVDGPDDSRSWVSFDVGAAGTNADGGTGATVRKLSTDPAGNLAVSPDGKYVLGGDKNLSLSDSTTGAILTDTSKIALAGDLADGGTNYTGFKTPAFSPSGTLVAAVESAGDWQYWDYTIANPSTLVLLAFDPATKTFAPSATKMIDSTFASFPSGQHIINYPSFTPDSTAVAYQVGDHQSGCFGGAGANNCSNTTTQIGAIWLQSTTSTTPVRLSKLTDPPATADQNLAFEPTFNPTARGGYFWLVFTSERSWGNMTDVQGTPDNDKKRLWVSAIDPTTGTADPSHPAFFLEGQTLTTQNMRGFWSTASCIATPAAGAPTVGNADAGVSSAADGGAAAACVNGFDCCSGFCQSGVCVDPSALACSGLHAACTTTGDCCNNGAAVVCSDNVCTSTTIR